MTIATASPFANDPQAQAILRRRALSERLQQQAMQQDFRSPLSPVASVAQTAAGLLGAHFADRDLREYDTGQQDEARQFMARMLGGGGVPTAPAAAGGNTIPAVAQSPLPPAGGSPAVAPADLMPLIDEASRETGIPVPILTAQIRQESNFDPNARGRAGEIGLAQIMPATARQPGFGVPPADPARLAADPRENILFGARYLRGRGQAAGVTDWNDPAQVDRALAAYNGGGDPNYVQNVRRWMGQGGQGAAIPAQAQAQPDAAPAAAPGAGGNMQQAALEAMMSRNPRIAALAPTLAQMGRTEDRTQTVAPGSYIMRNGQVVGQVPAAPQQPSETERLMPRWQQLAALGENATPQQAQERDMLARRIGGAGVTVNNNNTPEGALARDLSGRGAARIDTLYPQATQAADAMGTAQRVQQLLQSGVITGTGAGLRESIERAFATAGLVDGQRVANTGQLMSELANATLAAAGGLSGPTSDRDILFLREVAGGNIALTSETIRRITQVAMDRANRTLNEYNRIATAVQEDNSVAPTVRQLYRPIPVPTVDARPAPPAQQQGATAQGVQADPPPRAPAPPRTGEVRDGFRFRGGNPGDPASWERLR